MTMNFKVGDHVRWNSEAGHVRGRIIKVHTRDTEYKGHPRHCTEADPVRNQERQDRTHRHAQRRGAAQDLTQERNDDWRRPVSCELAIWTIGHSTRPLNEFLALLEQHRIEAVADVRRFPGSRRCPQYGRVELQACLAKHHLEYQWLPALGGRRRPAPDSANIAWRNPGFRGYADYMQTPEFAAGLDQLLDLARRTRTTLMCAESMWWRCHRSMIADALRARGITVVHILDAEHSTPHPWTEPARIVNGRLTYAAAINAERSR